MYACKSLSLASSLVFSSLKTMSLKRVKIPTKTGFVSIPSSFTSRYSLKILSPLKAIMLASSHSGTK